MTETTPFSRQSTNLLETAVEAGRVPEVPKLEGLLPGLLGHTSQEHRLVHLVIKSDLMTSEVSHLEEFVVALVDDGPGQASVHAESEVLLDGEQLHPVVLPVREDLVAEHCAHWVVPDVVGNPDPAPEELDGQVLVVANVEQHSVLLLRCERDCYICLRLHIQRFQFNVGDVVQEAQAGEILAPLAAVARSALADVVRASGDVHADPVLAIVLLARRCLWVEMRHHRFDLAELAGELSRALASVLVRPVTTSAPVLAHVVCAVVNVGRTVLPDEAGKTFTGEVGEVILAGASVLARVWLHPRAEGDLLLTVATLKPRRALTLIRSHLVDTVDHHSPHLPHQGGQIAQSPCQCRCRCSGTDCRGSR